MLFKLGIKEPKEGVHVCFEGPERELPKGELGTYETSIPLHKALDPSQDVMIADMQNGREVKAGSPVSSEINHSLGISVEE